MKTIALACVLVAAIAVGGCHREKPVAGPVKGTLNMDNLTPEEKIRKVQEDKTIPDQYKETFITSIRAQEEAKKK
jgi:hypothetical protein